MSHLSLGLFSLQVGLPSGEHRAEARIQGHGHHDLLLSLKLLSPVSKELLRFREGLLLRQILRPHKLQLSSNELHCRVVRSVGIVAHGPIIPIHVAVLETEIRILQEQKIEHLRVGAPDGLSLQVQAVILHRGHPFTPFQPCRPLLEQLRLAEPPDPRDDVQSRHPPEIRDVGMDRALHHRLSGGLPGDGPGTTTSHRMSPRRAS
mmetsp:Transcript_94158/g.269902  ORF Transcript_94158/g.269902 Transcript_94158/m.269902 type:complete len:205 (+) Transcript_94158:830-1444(+)